ncbi:hypothetical protein EVAR_41972_1 [Eumeta japonica]|uniref:Uncharacterized protein n=1 Tax=Eumeta variegata TaxID=151549 RepID=A0A4C1WU47_EUMVA|nr:hypothetical protein EVAR_41972_1 [Eumeta japonica]
MERPNSKSDAGLKFQLRASTVTAISKISKSGLKTGSVSITKPESECVKIRIVFGIKSGSLIGIKSGIKSSESGIAIGTMTKSVTGRYTRGTKRVTVGRVTYVPGAGGAPGEPLRILMARKNGNCPQVMTFAADDALAGAISGHRWQPGAGAGGRRGFKRTIST